MAMVVVIAAMSVKAFANSEEDKLGAILLVTSMHPKSQLVIPIAFRRSLIT
jgi:hypothetical protein